MELEKFIQLLIYMHVGLGGIALLTGAIALIFKKGSKIHKKAGKIFFFSMLASASISLIVSMMPNHESPFLFSIGVFSSYLLLSGLSSLKFKQREFDLRFDKWIAYLVMTTGILMILYPLLLNGKLNIILLVFGFGAIIFGYRDLKLFRDVEKLKKSWLKLHLGKMTGGYIAAVSAFFVVNEILPGIWNWFTPTIFGSVYITYWMMKLNNKSASSKKELIDQLD